MIRIIALVLLASVFGQMAEAGKYRDTSKPMTVVSEFDIQPYLGRWYEIARFPNRFERNCVGVTADYSMRVDGQVDVLNTCRKKSLDGKVKTAKGVARIEDDAKLSVTFTPWLPFLRGDYWVLYLTPDYSVAVVGEPKGRTGWILARTPDISPAARNLAEAALTKNGYNPALLITVPQAIGTRQ